MISHENGLIFIHIPYNSGNEVEQCYLKKSNPFISAFDTKKLAKGEPLIGANLSNTIKQFFDYDLFSIVKSPYLRAYDMWVSNQSLIRKTKYKKLTIGEYLEFILNKYEGFADLYIGTQKSHLVSTGAMYGINKLEFEVSNLFPYEDIIDNKFENINSFLETSHATPFSYFVDTKYDEDWRENYNKNSINMVNYIFDEDFQYCGYQKI